MTTTAITGTEYLTCGRSWMGARVRCLGGVQAGRVGTVVKVNSRSIRVALDSKPNTPSDLVETVIGHAIYFEAI